MGRTIFSRDARRVGEQSLSARGRESDALADAHDGTVRTRVQLLVLRARVGVQPLVLRAQLLNLAAELREARHQRGVLWVLRRRGAQAAIHMLRLALELGELHRLIGRRAHVTAGRREGGRGG